MNTPSTRPFYHLSVKIRRTPTAIGSLALAILMFVTAYFIIKLPLADSLIGALIGVVLHWALEFVHHLGHAFAAKRTGYPMLGVKVGLFYILMMSVYAKDEPELPPNVHIQRALGGPIFSGLLGIVFLVLVLLTRDQNDLLAWLLRLGLFESFLMSIGALAPVRFIDGGTILYWMRRSREQNP